MFLDNVTLVRFFFFFPQTLLFNCNSFTLVANKYLLTYLLGMMNHKEIYSSLIILYAAIRIYHCFLEIFSCLTNKIDVKFLMIQQLPGIKILSDIISKSNICQPLSVFSVKVTFKMMPCIYSPPPTILNDDERE